MSLEPYRVLCEVVRTGSFTRASEALNLSQPAVSMQMKVLEQEFKVRIFDRTSKGVQLTEAGKVIYETAAALVRQYEETQQIITDMQNLRRGTIHITATPVAGIHILPEIIARFHERYPYVVIHLQIDHFWEIIQHLTDNVIELAVYGGGVPVDTSILEVRPFLADELVVIAPPGFDWQDGSFSPADLCRFPFVAFGERSALRQTLTTQLKEQGITLETNLVLGHTESIKQAVMEGCGISIVSEHAVLGEVRAGLLKCYRLEGLKTHRSYNLAWHKNKRMSIALKTFIDFVLAECSA